jgi:hypothetical protein
MIQSLLHFVCLHRMCPCLLRLPQVPFCFLSSLSLPPLCATVFGYPLGRHCNTCMPFIGGFAVHISFYVIVAMAQARAKPSRSQATQFGWFSSRSAQKPFDWWSCSEPSRAEPSRGNTSFHPPPPKHVRSFEPMLQHPV